MHTHKGGDKREKKEKESNGSKPMTTLESEPKQEIERVEVVWKRMALRSRFLPRSQTSGCGASMSKTWMVPLPDDATRALLSAAKLSDVMGAGCVPRRNSRWSVPVAVSKTRMSVPLLDAVATSVPSGLMPRHERSFLCACTVTDADRDVAGSTRSRCSMPGRSPHTPSTMSPAPLIAHSPASLLLTLYRLVSTFRLLKW